MSSAPRRWCRDGRWPFQEIEGLAVVVVPERREVHQLDEVGSFVWELLSEPRTLDQLADAVAAEFEVERADALRDLGPFLDGLRERGLAS